MDDLRLYTVREAAKVLRLSRETVYQLVYSGELRSIQMNRWTRIPHTAIAEWIERKADETADRIHPPSKLRKRRRAS